MVRGDCTKKRKPTSPTQARKALQASRAYQTVDERNPAPTEMYETLCGMGVFLKSQYVSVSYHPKVDMIIPGRDMLPIIRIPLCTNDLSKHNMKQKQSSAFSQGCENV